MARTNSFDMSAVITVVDQAAATALAAKLRAKHHKDLLEIIIEACVEGPVTAQQVVDAYDAEESLNEEQLRIYNKYSKSAHMRYLVNRCRGVIAATLNGKEIIQTTTAGTKPKAKKEKAPEVSVEAALAAAE